MPDSAELLRLRERTHTLVGDVAALGWRLDVIERWQQRADEKIDALSDAEMLRRAVSDAVKASRRFEFTVLQKTGALVVLLLAVAGSIKGLLA